MAVALTGCTDEADECVPSGRVFLDSNEGPHLDARSAAPVTVAVGGIERLAVRCWNGGHAVPPYQGVFVAETVGDAVAVAETERGFLTIAGVHEGRTGIAIVDPRDHRRLDTDTLEARIVDRADYITYEKHPADTSLAFAPDSAVMLDLHAGEVPVVDDAMTLTIRGVRAPSTGIGLDLKGVPIGEYTLDVVAGDQDLAVPLIITDRADAIVAISPPVMVTHVDNTVCFAAMHAGRAVVGLAWTYAVDGTTFSEEGLNCVHLDINAMTGPPVTITANAGGASTKITIPWGFTPV